MYHYNWKHQTPVSVDIHALQMSTHSTQWSPAENLVCSSAVVKHTYACWSLTAVRCCRPEAALDMHYTSDTEYSDDDGSDEEEEDDISVCSGSTISAGGQSCTASDLMRSGFDEAYSDGTHLCRHFVCYLLCHGQPTCNSPRACLLCQTMPCPVNGLYSINVPVMLGAL